MPEAGTFIVEYAKSSRSVCKKCQKLISEETPRIGIYVQSRFFDGATPLWYHAACSLNAHVGRKLMHIDALKGLDTLRWNDQEKIRSTFTKILDEISASGGTVNVEGLQVEYAKSGGSKCRACEEKIPKAKVRIGFLVDGPYGPVPAWHHVDCFVENYPEKCNNSIDEFMGINKLSENDLNFLKTKIHKNLLSDEPKVETPTKTNQSVTVDSKKLKQQTDQIWKIKDYITSELHKEDVEKILKDNQVVTDFITEKVRISILADYLCFGLPEVCQVCGKSRMIWNENSQEYQCPIENPWGKCLGRSDYSIETVSCLTGEFKKLKQFKKRNRIKVLKKVPLNNNKNLKSLKRKEESAIEVMKVQVKNKTFVDPESGLSETHHVYSDQNLKYSATLVDTNVQTGRKSYYNIQLLEADNLSGKRKKYARYYLWRRWGRVGTDIGDCRLERCDSITEGIDEFSRHFEQKTGNIFGQPFEKKPRLFHPLDLADPEYEAPKPLIEPGSKTNQPKEIQNFLLLIFNVETIQRQLVEMEFDVQKMPLGQLSSDQIGKAFQVLSEIASIISSCSNKNRVFELSNQFYTLIPHNFGSERPKPLDSVALVKEKMEMLNELGELEVAVNIIQSPELSTSDIDPLDFYFQSLNANISCLSRYSSEFHLISESLRSTHAPTHSEYSLELMNVFVVERQGEREVYEKFISESNKELFLNRLLLWHGSRVSNYPGIISQGLRIAPAEVPNTGAMFGKGIYFADLVSKSANYCCVTDSSQDENVGLLILSEVALGTMLERNESEFIESLPPKYHSTKGCGLTVPSSFKPFPSHVPRQLTNKRTTRSSVCNVSIPIGPPKKRTDLKKSELLYNEYIIYDSRQSLLRFVVQVKFNKRRR